ncbi:MAG TPA: hypothetical protein VI485_08225 [Vicinamibacterales bacterium]|nr:hypothetical protein [Vicinamibacterales bacterium]
MTKLHHETATDGRGGIPGWWFGAPLIAFVYAFATPRLLPDIVSVPATLPAGLAGPMRWFIGLVLGVVLLSTWHLIRWAGSTRAARHR